MARYISSNEAVWRILDFPIQQRYPAIIQLAVHLENGQRIYFTENNIRERIHTPPKTMLTSYLHLCGIDEFAKSILYQEILQYYTCQVSSKSWKRRLHGDRVSDGLFKSEAIGRIYSVHPKNLECFYLRLLLTTVRGAVSLEDIKTEDGFICTTFKKTCQLLNLLEDDEHWQKTIEEAAISKSPNKIRTLFPMMICHCEISDIPALWMVNRECMSEDILHRYRRDNEEQNYTEEIFTTALQLLQEKVQKIGGERMENYGFEEVEIISTVSDEHNYEVIIQENEIKLNDE